MSKIKNISSLSIVSLSITLAWILVFHSRVICQTPKFTNFSTISPKYYSTLYNGAAFELNTDIQIQANTFKKGTKIFLGIDGGFDHIFIDKDHVIDNQTYPPLSTLLFYPQNSVFAAFKPVENMELIVAFDRSKKNIFPGSSSAGLLTPDVFAKLPCQDYETGPWSIGLAAVEMPSLTHNDFQLDLFNDTSTEEKPYVLLSVYPNNRFRQIKLLRDYSVFPKGTVIAFSSIPHGLNYAYAFIPKDTVIGDKKIPKNTVVQFLSDGQIIFEIPSATLSFDEYGGVTTSSPVFFHLNGSIDGVLIDNEIRIDKRDFPSGTRMTFYQDGSLAGFTLPKDGVIDGISVKGDILQCLMPDGSSNLLLSTSHTSGGNTYPANSYLIRNAKGIIQRIMLSEDTAINGIKIRSGLVRFYPNGNLKQGTLDEAHNFEGTHCAKGSPFFLGPDGKAYYCKLSQDLTIEKTTFKAGEFFTGFIESEDEPIKILDKGDILIKTAKIQNRIAEELRKFIESFRGKPGVGAMSKIELRQQHQSFSRNSINFSTQYWIEDLLENSIFSDCDCTITVPSRVTWTVSDWGNRFLAHFTFDQSDIRVSCDGCPLQTVGLQINSLNSRYSGHDTVRIIVDQSDLSPSIDKNVLDAFNLIESNSQIHIVKCSTKIKEFYIEAGQLFVSYRFEKRLFDVPDELPEGPCPFWTKN